MNKENLDRQMAERLQVDEPVDVSNIRLDLPIKVNPNVRSTIFLVSGWLQQYVAKDDYLETNLLDFAVFAAYCYPQADQRQLFAVARLMIWVYVFDDQIMEKFPSYAAASVYVQEYLRVWDTQDLEQAAKFCTYCHMMMAAYQTISQDFSPSQQKRFRVTLHAYLEGASQERKLHEGQTTTEEYMRIRNLGSGTDLFLRFSEASAGCDVSPYVEDALFRRNENACINISSWLNDLYSYNRERSLGERSNLVYQIRVNEQVSAQVAFNRVMLLMYEELEVFKQTAQELLDKYPTDSGLRRYLDEITSFYTGNQVFSYYSSRYVAHNRNVDMKRYL